MCDWFALCDTDAVATRAHPILGPLDLCDGCADVIGAPITDAERWPCTHGLAEEALLAEIEQQERIARNDCYLPAEREAARLYADALRADLP